MSEWYYSDYERNRLGPVAARDLADLHHAGQLQPETLVWREGMPQWRPWREVMTRALNEAAGLAAEAVPLSAGVNPYAMAEPMAAAPAATAAATPTAPSLGTLSSAPAPTLSSGANPYAVAEPHSPYAPPRAALQDANSYVSGGYVVYAGFWKRVAASIIDSVVLMVVLMVLAVVLGVAGAASRLGSGDPAAMSAGAMMSLGLFYIFEIVGIALYFAMMHASSMQASLGKMAVGIKVTTDDGERISFWRGVGRYFAYILSSLLFCVGLAMAAFTDRKRALHDMMCSTLVVDKWAYTAHPERQREELGVVTIVVLVIGGLMVLAYFALIAVLIAGLASMAR